MVRLKHRYIIGQIISENSLDSEHVLFNSKDLQLALKTSVQTNFGDFGTGSFLIFFRYFDAESGIFVLRCGREHEVQVHFALSCIDFIKKHPVIVRSLGIAGSARTCSAKLAESLNIFVEFHENCQEKNNLQRKYSEQLSRLEI